MPKDIEYFSNGAQIHQYLKGRLLEAVMQDGEFLILRFRDGHEAKIGWQDAGGNKLKGSPFLENLDVKIVLTGVGQQ